MLGFAVVDVTPDGGLAVWLTSRTGRDHAGHTNAVVFVSDDVSRGQQSEQMVADRVVLLTDRSTLHHGWGTRALNAEHVEDLAAATRQLQSLILNAYEQRRQSGGKKVSVDPTFPAIPGQLDQKALLQGEPEVITLAVANNLAQTWSAWLGTESERLRRLRTLPRELQGKDLRVFPEEFEALLEPVPLRKYR